MKRILFCLLVLTGFVSNAQVYNNEWIDHSKTYFKFKVGKNGLFRIPQATLATAGLGSTPAEQFQLWRNGVEVPIYTSVASGALSGSDYIEFWGEMNDGKPDKGLYRRPEYQLNDKWSLQTDSATYFLTVNAGANKRLVSTANNIAGNTLPAEPYFMYKAGQYYRSRINNGFAVNVGDYMYSSSYDKGEGWSSGDIGVNGTATITIPNLFYYSGGPNATFAIAVSGNAINQRRYLAKINNDSIVGNSVDFFNYERDTATFNSSILSTNSAVVTVTNFTEATSDRMVVHQYELTYPRQFNFGGAANFEFNLPANAAGNYLEISGFNYGSDQPVLYDLTNGQRYVGDISTPSVVKVVLTPSATERRLVLVSEETANVSSIATMQSRTFIDYRQAQNQADYIIISNPLLFNGPGGVDPVEEYRLYRGSSNGGAYNAKTYLADDLIDQFAFGIKKHPAGIRNFIMFARNNFSVVPKHVLLLGKGVNYIHQRSNENHADINKLNLVPTFGWPASDILLAADPGDSYPKTSIGRLSVINGQEILDYLKKVKEFEAAQKFTSPLIKDKAWMKNVVHVVGASEPGLQLLLDHYMNNYSKIISDTLFGANVNLFTKTSPDAVQQINNGSLDQLFEEGISLITYFGHSSTTTLEFNLNNPEQYNNQGKYPMFIALGCNVGNFYNLNTVRFSAKETLSEKFVLAKDRGTIGFIASSHYGIVHYLDIYNTRTYRSMAYRDYGKSIGEIMQAGIAQTFAYTTQEDFYARATAEETILNGDPAVTLNPHPKPDYAIEESMVRLNPSFVSVADNLFKLNAKFINLGKAVDQNIVVQVKRTYPNGLDDVIFKDTIPGIRYADSIELYVPIDALRDKGINKLTVSIDSENGVEELFENNNTITKEILIFENEARPVYPYNFGIVNKQNIKLLASTADPFSTSKQYRMELDTTERFNSPIKISKSINSVGGVIEFDPGITYVDKTVYYWRVGLVQDNGDTKWSNSSFVYLANHEIGYNQSHEYQHRKSELQRIELDSVSKKFEFTQALQEVFVRHGVYPTTSNQNAYYYTYINGQPKFAGGCGYNEINFNVIDPNTFKPWVNTSPSGGLLYNSNGICGPDRQNNFMYFLNSSQGRKNAMDFLDLIPSGAYVIVRNNAHPDFGSNTFVNAWKADTALFGSGNSLYHKLYNQGIVNLDSFNRPRAFAFVFKKDDKGFTPVTEFSEDVFNGLTLNAVCMSLDFKGSISSPVFGPAKQWKKLLWNGSSEENPSTDEVNLMLIGIKQNGIKDTLYNNIQPRDFDISSVDAQQYPYLKMQLQVLDSANSTPYQLNYWRLTYIAAPEGAVAPNVYFQMKDTLDIGEPLNFKMAFQNISDANFQDSLKIKMIVTDKNNVTHVLPVQRHRPLGAAPDTLHVRYPIDTKQLVGANTLFVEVNPDNDQPEQYQYNNFIYKNFYVRNDSLNPTLDVTFDRQHILNGDIVAAKPFIEVKLKDEAKWMLLDDTALISVQVIDPDNVTRMYHFDNDTLRFVPAQQAPNTDNTASINFYPHFVKDGTYQLIVSGKDRSKNTAGNIEYKVNFEVINKPMISNVFNYPNPFTTSTAFVFTITGAEVPQNLKIQILTVTGKIVREITREELGSLRVGRNITDYKWDGTDQYGQKLGNGVYLYRVITNLNGKSLDKYQTGDTNTDKFFNNEYGKMYLMR